MYDVQDIVGYEFKSLKDSDPLSRVHKIISQPKRSQFYAQNVCSFCMVRKVKYSEVGFLFVTSFLLLLQPAPRNNYKKVSKIWFEHEFRFM